ncbi:unnamed protein product [Oreochromis niloticus]|nr:unnamed protein product [Mustela putorius furo]
MAAQCVTKVELTVSCENLLDKDVGSKSDPLCVLLMNSSDSQWYEVGRTEKVQNCLSPKFAKKFVVDYYFEIVQKLKFGVYDIDNKTIDLTDDDFLGELECTLGQVVSSKKLTRPLVLKNKSPAGKGTITINAEEIKDNRVVNFEVAARKLDNKDLFGKSDPYLEFYKQTETGWQLAHRTEVVKNNLNPTWRPFRIPLQSLCGGDMEKPIKVECYDYDNDGSHDLIGVFETTMKRLQEASHTSPAEFECINSKKKQKKKGYKNSGVVSVKLCQVVKEYTFLDYIMGGCQINFTVPTGIPGHPSLCITLVLRVLTSTSLQSGQWVMSSRTMTAIRCFLHLALEPRFHPHGRFPMSFRSISTHQIHFVQVLKVWLKPTEAACRKSNCTVPPISPRLSTTWPALQSKPSSRPLQLNILFC